MTQQVRASDAAPELGGSALTRGLHDVGLIALALGAASLPALALDLMSGPTSALSGLVAVAVLGMGGGVAAIASTPAGEPRDGAEALIAVALGWLIAALLAALPFHLAARLDPAPVPTLAAFERPAVALFEAMSGITGTGLSVSSDPSVLPPSLQLWRSITQWVGGIGWMLLALLLLAPHRRPSRGDGDSPYRRHLPQLSAERTTDELSERTRHPVASLWAIYAAYTLAAMVALRLAGMPAWESVNHALTGISTGGFAVTPDSFRSYGDAVLWVTLAIMLAGSISFSVHFAWIALSPLTAAERRQLLWLMGCLVAGTGVALLALAGTQASFVEVAFNMASALATCGFVAQSLDAWPVAGLLVLSAGMFVGASSGSTGGGLKMRRMATIFDGLGRRIASASESGEKDEDTGDEDMAQYKRLHDAAARLCFLALAVAAGLIAILMLTPGADAPLEDVLLDATAALSTAGLSTGFVGPDLPSGTLMVFVGLMWLGRLEVLAVLVTVLAAARMGSRAAVGPLRRIAGRKARATSPGRRSPRAGRGRGGSCAAPSGPPAPRTRS